jgi:hypothetical protein
MVRILRFVGVLLLAFLVGCDQASLIERMTPAADEAAAKRYVDLLRHNQFDQIEKDLDPRFKGPHTRDALIKMAGLLPGEEPVSTKVVSVGFFHNNQASGSDLTLEYEFPQEWFRVHVMQTRDTTTPLFSLGINPLPDSLENTNRFTLIGKNGSEYAMLLLTVLCFGFSIYAFVVCMRTKPLKRKWLWVIATLIGVCSFSVNWTTGQFSIALFALHLPPGGGFAFFYGPWNFYISIPVGAIFFLGRRSSGHLAGMSRQSTDNAHSAGSSSATGSTS